MKESAFAPITLEPLMMARYSTGFDAAVRDMAVGETKKVHLSASEAYGEHDDQLVQTIPTANVPGAEELPVGQTVYLQGPGGQPLPALVVDVNDETVTFDLNHEMAGKDLNFEITLVEILD